MNEVWRFIRETDECYSVSNYGRVYSHVRNQMLSPDPHSNGYVSVWLSTISKRRYIHRLVCEAFFGPPPSRKHQVGHRNNIRTKNFRSNVRWVTPKEQWKDRIRHGNDGRGQRNGRYIDGRSLERKG